MKRTNRKPASPAGWQTGASRRLKQQDRSLVRHQRRSEQESPLKSFQILLVGSQTIPGTRRNALALDQLHGMLPLGSLHCRGVPVGRSCHGSDPSSPSTAASPPLKANRRVPRRRRRRPQHSGLARLQFPDEASRFPSREESRRGRALKYAVGFLLLCRGRLRQASRRPVRRAHRLAVAANFWRPQRVCGP